MGSKLTEILTGTSATAINKISGVARDEKQIPGYLRRNSAKTSAGTAAVCKKIACGPELTCE
jgi:hypothetical protein